MTQSLQLRHMGNLVTHRVRSVYYLKMTSGKMFSLPSFIVKMREAMTGCGGEWLVADSLVSR